VVENVNSAIAVITAVGTAIIGVLTYFVAKVYPLIKDIKFPSKHYKDMADTINLHGECIQKISDKLDKIEAYENEGRESRCAMKDTITDMGARIHQMEYHTLEGSSYRLNSMIKQIVRRLKEGDFDGISSDLKVIKRTKATYKNLLGDKTCEFREEWDEFMSLLQEKLPELHTFMVD